MTCGHLVGDVLRGDDHAVAGPKRARVSLVAIGALEIRGVVAVHHPDAGALLQRGCAARGADADRMHKIDTFGGDKIGKRAPVARQRERIGGFRHKPHPLATKALQFAVERAVLGGDDHARAGAQQCDRGIDRGARGWRLDERRENMENGRARQAAHGLGGVGVHHRHDGPLAFRRALRRNTVRREAARDAA